jgi:hypothetical protein
VIRSNLNLTLYFDFATDHMKMYEGRASKKWLALAASSSSRTNECANMAAAAFITGYSESAEAAVAMFSDYHREMDRLLAMPSLGMEQFNEDDDPFQVRERDARPCGELLATLCL